MTSDRGAGLPRTSLTPTSVTVQYGTQGAQGGSAANWFGPLDPLKPLATPDVAGRQFDFQPGFNLTTRPRAYEGVSFSDLRMLGEAYDLLRLVIETRKDQVERMAWSIRAKEGQKAAPKDIDRVTAFFAKPDGKDGEHDFTSWTRALLEDLFVIDAPALWCERNRGGQLLGLHPLDGATIKPVIDPWGRRPRPVVQGSRLVYPVAYQQILKGLPAVDYTTRDLIYAPRNRRTNRVFGLSPVEQIIMSVSIAMRRQVNQLEYYTAGNIPEALIGVPDTWTPDQIKNFQDYWDAYFTGDIAARRKAKFVPGGVAKTFIQTKEPELKSVFDEWLARVVCFAFSIPPNAFTQMTNRATANTQKEQAEEEGLYPILLWIKRLINGIIARELDAPNCEFAWNQDTQIDPAAQATMHVALVGAGIITRNEAREERGDDPMDNPAANLLMVTTPGGLVPIEETLEPGEPVAPPAQFMPPQPGQNAPQGGKPPQGKTEPGKAPVAPHAAPKPTAKEPSRVKGKDTVNGVLGPGENTRVKAPAAKVAKGFNVDQPRDDHGRFGSGGSSSRPSDAEEKAAFRQGVKKVALSVALTAGAALAVALAPEAVGVATVAALAEKAAGGMLLSTAATSLNIVCKQLGLPDDASDRALDHIMSVMKGADASDGETAYVVDLAKRFLPKIADAACEALLNHLDAEAKDADPAKRHAADDGIEKAKAAFLAKVDAIEAPKAEKLAFAPAGTFTKGARYGKPVPLARKATKDAIKSVAAKLRANFKVSGASVADQVRKALDGAEKLAKADTPEDDAAKKKAAEVAKALNLSAMEQLAADLGVDLGDYAGDSASHAIAQIGPNDAGDLVDQVNDRAVSWGTQRGAELVGKRVLADGSIIDNPNAKMAITDATRNMVQTAIADGLANNIGVDGIIENIQQLGFSDDRADLIARTEITSANSQGALTGYQGAADAGVDLKKAWLTSKHEKGICDVCQENEDAGPIELDAEFPSGDQAPGAHPRCECALVPVVSD